MFENKNVGVKEIEKEANDVRGNLHGHHHSLTLFWIYREDSAQVEDSIIMKNLSTVLFSEVLLTTTAEGRRRDLSSGFKQF